MVALIPEGNVMCSRSPGIAACNPAHVAMLLMLFIEVRSEVDFGYLYARCT